MNDWKNINKTQKKFKLKSKKLIQVKKLNLYSVMNSIFQKLIIKFILKRYIEIEEILQKKTVKILIIIHFYQEIKRITFPYTHFNQIKINLKNQKKMI